MRRKGVYTSFPDKTKIHNTCGYIIEQNKLSAHDCRFKHLFWRLFISKTVYNFLEVWAEMLSGGVCDKKVRSILLSSYLQETQSSGNWKPIVKAASSSFLYLIAFPLGLAT